MTDPAAALDAAASLVAAGAAFAIAVRPDPAVAAARAERAQGLTRRRAAHHRGTLTEARHRLERAASKARGARRDALESRLAGVVETLAGL